ncbi:MAG: MFS transporter [Anaerorhabdus sp.]
MKISNRTKWTYSVGGIGRDMMFVLVSMFILAYVQYTMDLTVAQFSVISIIMILSRVWDAINDPMMGIIIENSRFKSGKFRPWILFGGISNFVVTLLLFTYRPDGWNFVIFFGIAYILWGMTFTINDISYWSLLPNLSKNNEERNNLTNLVTLFANIGQFLAGGLIPILVTGNAILMYRVVGVVISFIFLVFTLITYFGVEEQVYENKDDKKINYFEMLKIFKNNKQLIVVAIAILLHTISGELFVALALNFFYFEFGYGGIQLTIFTVVFGIGTLFALFLFPTLSKKYKRMKLLVFGTIISTIGYLIFLSLGYVLPMNEGILYSSVFMVFFGQSLFFVIVVVMCVNTIEYNELKTGKRNESIIFSIRPFMTKLGAAFQQAFFSLVLVFSGVYSFSNKIADLEIAKEAGTVANITTAANEIIAQATPSMLLSLRLGMALIPMLCLVGATVVLKKYYILDEDKHKEILNKLEMRNNNG